MCANCHEQCGCINPLSDIEEKEITYKACCLNDSRNTSQQSIVYTMLKNSVPNLVYSRRKFQGQSVTISQQAQVVTNLSKDYLSVAGSHVPEEAKESRLASQDENDGVITGSSVIPLTMCNREHNALVVNHLEGCLARDMHNSVVASKHMSKVKEVDSVNDSCSSSKSNLEPVSPLARADIDGTGECSSSSAVILEDIEKELSAKDMSISVLKNVGLLESVMSDRIRNSLEDEGSIVATSCSRPCKVCGNSETTLKMLLCDHCDEAFHVSCSNSRIKKNADEWFCHSCLKKKRKILKETGARKSSSSTREVGRCRSASNRDELSPIALMLDDTEPYTTSVRIGKGFQADVPDWSGPVNNAADTIDEPVEMNPAEPFNISCNSSKTSRISSIGNWLQCREVIDGVGRASGTICGKWRRAPLFEAQSDDWECFCSVLWDPKHADCAVPQELETEQVLKQLKYIEMLRPRLAAKRRKLDSATTVNMQDDKEVQTKAQ